MIIRHQSAQVYPFFKGMVPCTMFRREGLLGAGHEFEYRMVMTDLRGKKDPPVGCTKTVGLWGYCGLETSGLASNTPSQHAINE